MPGLGYGAVQHGCAEIKSHDSTRLGHGQSQGKKKITRAAARIQGAVTWLQA